jgi:Protein of unknown function (DUF3108)
MGRHRLELFAGVITRVIARAITGGRLSVCTLAAVAMTLLAGVVNGGASAEELVADYTAYWAGLPAAQVRLKISDAAAAYQDEIEIRSEGLPRLITHFRVKAQAGGRLVPGRPAEPSRYDALYDVRRWRNSRIAMRFIAHDGAVVAERAAEDNSRKALLDEQYRRDITDPLTAFETVRAEIAAHNRAPDTAFVVPVYDGTRRFDVVAHILPKAEQSPGVLRLALNLRPIAGFKGQSKVDGDPDNAPRPVAVTVTDDKRLLPISMMLRVFYLPLVIQLDRVCPGAKECAG